MSLETFTPSFISTILSILSFVVIGICFLIGFFRGTRKALYFFIITLVIIIGCWLIFPAIFNFLITIDISKFNFTFKLDEETTITITTVQNVLVEITSKFVTPEEGELITDTYTYQLLTAIVEMPVRIVFIVIVLVLNWTLFRLIFGIVYRIIRPSKKDKYGVKRRKTIITRLIGGLVGALNGIFILFIFCVPLAGVFSIGENSAKFVSVISSNEETQEVSYKVALKDEVINLDNESASIANFQLDQLEEWCGIYRNTFLGSIFQIKIGGVEIDNKVFDDLVAIDFNDSKLSIRKEVETLSNSLDVIFDSVITPYIENNKQFTPEMLDAIDGNKIANMFNELSKLEIIKLIVPVGFEVLPSFINTDENKEDTLYLSLNDVAKDLKDLNVPEMISQIGTFVGDMYDCIFDENFKPSDLMSDKDTLINKLIDHLITIDPEKLDKVFESLASINIIDAINETALYYLENSTLINATVDKYLLLKPVASVTNDNFVALNGINSGLAYNELMDFDKFEYSTNEDAKWVITYNLSTENVISDDITYITNIDSKDSQMHLSFKDVKLTDEIKQLGKIVSAFSNLCVNSFSDLQKFIKSGTFDSDDVKIDLSKFTYENVDKLISSILNLKIISNNIDNVDVIVNNIVPNDIRGQVNLKGIESNDITSLVMACKVVYDSGLAEGLIELSKKEDEEVKSIDYVEIINEYGDQLVDNLLNSKIIANNLTPVCNSLVKMFIGPNVFVIPELNWQTEGKTELKGLLNIVSVGLKYKDKFEDLSSLTDDEIEEIFNVIKDNLGKSIIVKSNLNNLVNYVNDLDSLKDMNVIVRPLDSDDDWTESEINCIVDALKILLKFLKPVEGEEFNVTKLFELTESEIDTITSSKFIVKTLAANLINYAKEGAQLEEYLAINLEENDSRWQNELNVTLKMLTKIMKGVTDLEDENITDILVENLTKLSVDSTDGSDDVSKILSSIVLTDSLVKIIKTLPDKTEGLIVVNDNEWFPIPWKDGEKPGEIRNLIKAMSSILIDDDGKVIINELNSYSTEQILDLLINISDAEVNDVSKSRILVDTIAKKIIDMANEEDAFININVKYKYINDESWNKEFFDLWSLEVKNIIISAKTLLIDSEGNSMSSKLLSNDQNELLEVVLELGEDEVKIGKVLESDTIYETIRSKVKDLANAEEGKESIISMPKGEDDIDTWNKNDWKVELKSVIYAVDKLLTEEVEDPENPGETIKKVNIDKLSSSDANKLLQVIVDLSDEELEKSLESKIITQTIASQIEKLGEGEDRIVNTKSTIDYKLSDWRNEILLIIDSVELLVVSTDSTGKKTVDTSVLSNGDTDSILQMIVDLNDGVDETGTYHEENDEIKVVLKSTIITDTISEKITDIADEENAIIVVNDEVRNYNQESWKQEIRNLILSSQTLLTDEAGNVDTSSLNSGDTDKVLQLVVDLKDGVDNTGTYHEKDDEIKVVLNSVIITDTISDKITDIADEENAIIVVNDEVRNYNQESWKQEIRNLVLSAKTLLTDEAGNVDTSSLNSGDTDKVLQLVVDLKDGVDNTGTYHEKDDEIKVVLNSVIITDTISDKITDIADEENAIIVVNDEVRNYNQESWKQEIRNLVLSAKTLLTDEAGNVDTSSLNSGDTDKVLQLVVDLKDGVDNTGTYHEKDDEIKVVLNSVIISDTISDKITDIADEENAIIVVNDDVRNYNQESWKLEIRNLILSCKILLTDEAGNVDTSSLSSGDTNKVLQLVADLDDGYDNSGTYHGENDKVKEVIASVIISDTISDKIIDLGCDDAGNPDDSSMIVVKNVVDFTRLDWQGSASDNYNGEIKKVIKACNIILREDDPENPGKTKVNIDKITKASSDELFELICNLNDSELNDAVSSTLITDTISKQIISYEGTLVISDEVKSYDTAAWRIETIRLIKSGRLVVGEKNEVTGKYEIDMNKVNGDSNFVINNVANLNDDPNGSNDELGTALASIIIHDTLVSKIEEQGKDKGNGGILVISSDVVWDDTYTGSTITDIGEIRKIIRGLRIIFEEEEDISNPGNKIVDIKLEKVTANEILSRTRELNNNPGGNDDEIGILINSSIISNTIIDTTVSESEKTGAIIIVNYNRESSEWFDIYSGDTFTQAGELRKMLASVKYLFKGEDNIDLNNFNVDNILELTAEEESIVFDSVVLIDTFYSEIRELGNNVIFIPNGMVENKTEAINFVESIKIVKGDKKIKDLDSTQFSLDTFIDGKTDSDYDILFASIIVKYSVSIRVLDYVTGTGDLAKYIEMDLDFNGNIISGTNEEIKAKRVNMIELDIENLVKVIRDLKQENGILYTDFSFTKFEEACKAPITDPDSTENADSVADNLTQSMLIVHSLKKMMNEVLSGSLSTSQLSSINLDMNTANRNYWTNYDINGNDTIENITIDPDNLVFDETGELRKILRLLTYVDTFAKDTGSTYSSYTDKDMITKPLLMINNSLVLNGLIPEFSETSLTNIKDWLYDPKSTLTKVMWDNEIDNLASIIVTINTNGLGNLNNLDVKTVNTVALKDILKHVSMSRIIDINHLEIYVNQGINSTFGTSVSVNRVYDGNDYDTKVSTWNAEINLLILALDKLQTINSTDISDSTIDPETGVAIGITNAYNIGQFLDCCSDTIMLQDIIGDVFDSVISKYGLNPSILSLIGINLDSIDSYEDTLVNISTYLVSM